MKVDELREKLAPLDKEVIIKLAIEFYKLVPKAKKEDNNLDALINAPIEKKAKPSVAAQALTLQELELEVNTFIAHAKEQYYLYPNKIVSKDDRTKWRFKVKAWYKELINTKRPNWDMAKQAEVLTNLYNLLCEACRYTYFSSDDVFVAIGVEQSDFYLSVIQLIDKVEGKIGVLNKGIGLIVNNGINTQSLYSFFMVEFVDILNTPDAKYKAIEKTVSLLDENNSTKHIPTKNQRYEDSTHEYRRKEKSNNLAEIGFRIYASLFEFNEAIEFYKQYTHKSDNEVKLYILIRLLMECEQKDLIKSELDTAIQEGIKLRPALVNLLKTINETQALPRHLY